MKTSALPLVRTVVFVGALCAALGLRAAPAAWESGEFLATISGTSTFQDWKVETHTASGELRTAGKGSGTLRIPAKSLLGESRSFNEKVHATLKVDAHADIVFEALEVAVPAEALVSPAPMSVHGRLTVAGSTRELVVPCRATLTNPTVLVLEAKLPLKMTDFGIKPPAFMGVFRAGDDVSVAVRWLLRPLGGGTIANPSH